MKKIFRFTTKKHTGKFEGTIRVASDKSITHRAFIFAGICKGVTIIKNPLLSDDCIHTLEALEKVGANIISKNQDEVIIDGVDGIQNFKSPNDDIFVGNSGTSARLLTGLFAGCEGLNVKIIGDESLSKRPMQRILKPLREMGADIIARDDNFLPLEITGKKLQGIDYHLPMPSAQVKSAILLAGLNASSPTTIYEKIKSRDHTEKIMQYLGIDLKIDNEKIILNPLKNQISNKYFEVPADISSVSFFIALGVLASDKGICLKDVCLNPTRDGIIRVLKRMNANITIKNEKINSVGEKVGDIIVKKSKLTGTIINENEIPLLVDEIPIISAIAIFAERKTLINNAGELRVKESDRIASIKKEFSKLGADITELEDGLIINGMGNDGFKKLKNCAVNTHYDHRMAMSLIILSKLLDGEMELDDVSAIETSFPNFFECLKTVMV